MHWLLKLFVLMRFVTDIFNNFEIISKKKYHYLSATILGFICNIVSWCFII